MLTRIVSAALCAIVVLWAADAAAESITFGFTVRVTLTEGAAGRPPLGSPLTVPVRVGDILTGALSFDPTVQPSFTFEDQLANYDTPGNISFEGGPAGHRLSITVENSRTNVNGRGALFVGNFERSNGFVFGGGLRVVDATRTAFRNSSLPRRAPRLASFQERTFFFVAVPAGTRRRGTIVATRWDEDYRKRRQSV
jgi:hypothetical protein